MRHLSLTLRALVLLPLLAVAESALLAGDPGAAVRAWRHAVWVG